MRPKIAFLEWKKTISRQKLELARLEIGDRNDQIRAGFIASTLVLDNETWCNLFQSLTYVFSFDLDLKTWKRNGFVNSKVPVNKIARWSSSQAETRCSASNLTQKSLAESKIQLCVHKMRDTKSSISRRLTDWLSGLYMMTLFGLFRGRSLLSFRKPSYSCLQHMAWFSLQEWLIDSDLTISQVAFDDKNSIRDRMDQPSTVSYSPSLSLQSSGSSSASVVLQINCRVHSTWFIGLAIFQSQPALAC